MTGISEAIWKLKKGGFDLSEASDIVSWMADYYKANTPAALAQLEEIYHTAEGQGVSDRISAFVDTTQGFFSATDCDKECQIVTKRDRENRRQILNRLVSRGLLEKHKTKNGLFRRVENDAPVIEWETADVSNIFQVSWPFELENYALMYPKNIAVLAGESNAGKTAFLLDTIRRNMAKHLIHYYSSEMGAEELKLRLSKFEGVDKWVFDPRERVSQYADLVKQYPDDIHIIDYIEIASGEYYLIASELRDIFDVLRKGIAIVALQKKKGAELGRGAEFSLEKPRLYLSMSAGVLKIIKAKNWAVEGENPNGMEFHFSLVNGAKFIYKEANG